MWTKEKKKEDYTSKESDAHALPRLLKFISLVHM